MDLFEYLANNSYPGRGIAVGKYDGKPVIAYFIMGRSANSRNRIFAREDDRLFTKAFDESRVKDPSLIIYNALRKYDDLTIVTNGDQTDTVYDFLAQGRTFDDALATREYEPDCPNYTPRISALMDSSGNARFSILKRVNGECVRCFWDYEGEDGKGRFISTYDTDGDPLPSFSGEPLGFDICEGLGGFGDRLWHSLNEDNKVSLLVRFGGEERIYNKNCGD